MTKAHTESVLNLRFDDRYLVTCSKDKSVKVWSRKAMHRSDPLVPSHIIPSFDNAKSIVDAHDMIAEYSLLTTFAGMQMGGHQAAVNAVQIHDNTIISASGDRHIKSWNLDTGKLNRTYQGHTKGIACVQFDGRRIVSGSSDNTVRIFDSETGAEVACLQGHANLVRTVQARFGDLDTVTDQELEDEANRVSMAFVAALENGMPMPEATRRRRNAGSTKPEDVTSHGTKIPPGGGGGRWAKIVSGSYDETVIIWKRDRDGKWQPRQTLGIDGVLRTNARRRQLPAPQDQHNVPSALQHAAHQAAVQAQQLARAQGQNIQYVQAAILAQSQNNTVAQGTQATAGQANGTGVHFVFNTTPAIGVPGAPPAQVQATQHQQAMAQLQAFAALHGHLPGQPGPAAPTNGHVPGAGIGASQDANQAQRVMAGNLSLGPLGTPLTQQPSLPPASAPGTQQSAAAAQPTVTQTPASQTTAPPAVQPPHSQPQAQAQPAPAAPAAAAGHGHGTHRDSNRVFKLQFDARRLICCSQNRVIVGWDFANGDKQLEMVGEWSVETA
jgi:F-box and WD-40 domain protein 1/11